MLSMSRSHIALVIALVSLSACKDSTLQPIVSPSLKGTVVLNGFGLQGATLVNDTTTATTQIPFGAAFDGSMLSIASDTLLSTSSKAGGDLLYVASLASGTLKTVQMPAGSNPAGALLFGAAAAQIAVALRDSQAIALVTNLSSATPTVTLLRNAGTCPVRVFTYDGELWVVDANQRCRTDYAILGPSRLIHVPLVGTARDTINLGPTVLGATSVVVKGDIAVVAGGGQVNFATVPASLVQGGTLVQVNMAGKTVIMTAPTPAGSFGTTIFPGKDGYLYTFVYADAATFVGRAMKVDFNALQAVGPQISGSAYLSLRHADSTLVNCSAVAGDIRGRIYCPENGAGSAATLYVYNLAGVLIRTIPAGQGAVDVGVR